MPTYEYVCQKCGYRFEEFQSIKAEPLKTCPQCNTNNLRRLIGSGAGLIFKGSGFYITDYKKNGQSASKQKTEADNKNNKLDKSEKTVKERSNKKET